MRSSASTRSRRANAPLRLLVVLAGEDHPRACTGRRLLEWGRATRLSLDAANRPGPVILDPYAPVPLSGADLAAAESGGVLVVDCSWNRLAERGSFPGAGFGGRRSGPRRRLPVLVATNPQHYGRIAQLNTVEAFCAALAVLGRGREAESVIAGFRGGDQFLPVNRSRLERYARSETPEEMLAAERELFRST